MVSDGIDEFPYGRPRRVPKQWACLSKKKEILLLKTPLAAAIEIQYAKKVAELPALKLTSIREALDWNLGRPAHLIEEALEGDRAAAQMIQGGLCFAQCSKGAVACRPVAHELNVELGEDVLARRVAQVIPVGLSKPP